MNNLNTAGQQDLISIKSLDLDTYLRGKGWEYQGQRGKYAHIFTLTTSAGKHTVAVPVFELLDDHAERVLDAVQTICAAESRTREEVIQEIKTTGHKKTCPDSTDQPDSTNNLPNNFKEQTRPMTSHPTANLAQQAFQIYDLKGEKAMLAFILENEETSQHAENMEPGMYLLNDGTAVKHDKEENGYYVIVYTTTTMHRPANIPIDKQPTFINQHLPLLPNPNSGNVIKEIMDRAEAAAREEIGLILDEDLVNLYDVLTLMPGLNTALRTAIAALDQKPRGRRMINYLDEMVTGCTDDTLATLPEEQFQKLIEAAKETLEKKGYPGS